MNKLIIAFSILIASLVAYADDASTNAAFQQAVTDYQQNPLNDNAKKVIALANGFDHLPTIPEEARKHFVKGGTLFKEAKDTNDLAMADGEFTQAIKFAPWWPEARYNCALTEEAKNDFTNALSDLRLYQLFKLPPDELRAVQDKIYKIEAKQERATKKQAEEQKAAEAAVLKSERDKIEAERAAKKTQFAGKWCEDSDHLAKVNIYITGSSDYYSAKLLTQNFTKSDAISGMTVTVSGTSALSDFAVNGNELRFKITEQQEMYINGVLRSHDTFIDFYALTISDDGNQLIGFYNARAWLNGGAERDYASLPVATNKGYFI
jgi:hypothetical protein